MKSNQVVDEVQDVWLVEAYAGRFYWFGPAVRADDERELQEIIRATEVEVQWDSLGEGYIVYPVRADREWYDENQDRVADDDEDEDD